MYQKISTQTFLCKITTFQFTHGACAIGSIVVHSYLSVP